MGTHFAPCPGRVVTHLPFKDSSNVHGVLPLSDFFLSAHPNSGFLNRTRFRRNDHSESLTSKVPRSYGIFSKPVAIIDKVYVDSLGILSSGRLDHPRPRRQRAHGRGLRGGGRAAPGGAAHGWDRCGRTVPKFQNNFISSSSTSHV